MASVDCTINSVLYSRSDWTGSGWQNDYARVAAGFGHTRASDTDWGWWRTQVSITIPQFTGVSSALIFKLTTDGNCYPLNSYAILRSSTLSTYEVGRLTKDPKTHGCSCTNKDVSNHELFSATALSGIISDSFAFADKDAEKWPQDNKSGTTVYYRFNTTNLKSGTYYIYILYKHRSGNYHGLVTGRSVSAELIYVNNKTLKVEATINGTTVSNFGNYADVYINNKKYSTYNNTLPYDTPYNITVTVPSTNTNKYHYTGTTPISGKLNRDKNVVLAFKTKCKVIFDANGGSLSRNLATVYKVYGSDITLPTPSRANYTFDGWYTAKNGGTLVSNVTDPSKPLTTSNVIDTTTYEKTFYAHWSANSCQVTYDANGGLFANNIATLTKPVAYGGYYPTVNNPTKSGHQFLGWFTSSGTQVTTTTKVTTTSNHTLYAKYEPCKYIITYEPNNGQKQYTQAVSYGDPFTVIDAPKKVGYKFDKWVTSYGDKTYTFDSGEYVTSYNFPSNKTFTARYDEGLLPTIRVRSNSSWKIVVPHVYDGVLWKPVKTQLNIDSTNNVWKQFDYYNWLS